MRNAAERSFWILPDHLPDSESAVRSEYTVAAGVSPHRRSMPTNPPLPTFIAETAAEKTRLAEDGWNTRDPTCVALAYTSDSR
jgi:hypothetical protein